MGRVLEWTKEDEIIVNNINKLLEIKGMTIKTLSEQSGITTNTLYDIRNKKRQNVGLRILTALAKGFGVATGVLIEGNQLTSEDMFINRQLVNYNKERGVDTL